MDIKIKFVKGIPINDVHTVTLSDMGFVYDAPIFDKKKNSDKSLLYSFYNKLYGLKAYVGLSLEKLYVRLLLEHSTQEAAFEVMHKELEHYGVTDCELISFLVARSLYGLDKTLAEKLIDEFVYLIENVIPRSIQDLFYFVGLDTNGAYWTFFDLPYQREVYFNDFKEVTGTDFNGRYDFVIYRKNKAESIIEYDGEQHFKFIEYYHGDMDGFEVQQYRDRVKDLYCERKGLHLLRIPYNKVSRAKSLIKENIL